MGSYMRVRTSLEFIEDSGDFAHAVNWEVPTSDVKRILDVNIMGTYFSYKYAAMQMIKQGKGGRIVGAASVAGKKGACW